MDHRLKKLVSLLEKNGIDISKEHLDEINYMGGLTMVIPEILPNHYFNYDAEVIDDIGGYYMVMSLHIEKARPEWNPEELKITGSIDGQIKIEFIHNSKKVSWKFEQNNSDYVSENFYKRLDNWVSRNLSGRFVMLPTGGQDVGFVYLPKDAATKLKRMMKNFVGIDEYVEFFRSDKNYPPEEFYQLRDSHSFNHCAVDSQGETALTAAIKNKNIVQIKNVIDFEFAAIEIKNIHGESPLHLARELAKEMEIPKITSELEERSIYSSKSWEELDWAWKYCTDDIELINLVKQVKRDKAFKQTFQCIPVLSSIWFAKSELIELGNETLYVASIHPVHRVENKKAFNISYSSAVGTSKDFRLQNITLEEALVRVHRFYDAV